MEKVKLEPEKIGKLRRASKVLYILAKIGKVLSRVGVVFIVLGVIIAALFINTLTIKNSHNVEMQTGDSVVELKIEDLKIKVKADGTEQEIGDITQDELTVIENFLNENSKNKLSIYIVMVGVITSAVLIIDSITLQKLEELFKNVHDEKIFTYENVDNLKAMSHLMLTTFLVSIVGNIILDMIIKTEGSAIKASLDVIQILFIYCMRFIFEYGCKIKENLEERLYGEVNE